jgi:hypothetical protein
VRRFCTARRKTLPLILLMTLIYADQELAFGFWLLAFGFGGKNLQKKISTGCRQGRGKSYRDSRGGKKSPLSHVIADIAVIGKPAISHEPAFST